MAPTGHYEVERLINVGTNRWAVRAELGYARAIRRVWIAEFQAGTWFFSDNDEFVGSTRQQDPVLALQAHFIREFASGLWAAFDVNYYTGGQTTVGGELRADLQRNSRLGGTLVYPFAGRHAAKLGYSFGAVTESGGDFSILLVSYTLVLP